MITVEDIERFKAELDEGVFTDVEDEPLVWFRGEFIPITEFAEQYAKDLSDEK
jgi:hypothetical protein